MAAEDNPLRRVAFVGIDNLNDERATKDGHLRDMVNFDPKRSGTLPSTREGYERIYTGAPHSLWGDGQFPWAVFVDGGELRGIQALQDPPTLLASGIDPRAPMSYARDNDTLRFANGAQGGVLRMDGQVYAWACEAPNGQPVATAIANGGLPAGEYQVAMTFRDDMGRESGTGLAVRVTVPAGGGIRLTAIPQPSDPGVLAARIYCSTANEGESLDTGGMVAHHVRDIPPGASTFEFGAFERGRVLKTQFMEPLPIGNVIECGAGTTYSAVDAVLYWGAPLYGAQGVLADSYMRFAARITVLAGVGDGAEFGLWVAVSGWANHEAGQVYYLAGRDPSKAPLRARYSYGAVPGTMTRCSGEVWGLPYKADVPCWLATNGFWCVGAPGGELLTFNTDTVAATAGERGASLVREGSGQTHVVTSVKNPFGAGLAIRDRYAVTVRRNGIEIP